MIYCKYQSVRYQEYILRFSHFTVRISVVRNTLYVYLSFLLFLAASGLSCGTRYPHRGVRAFGLGLLSCCSAWAQLS